MGAWRVLLSLALVPLLGCGATLQTLFGWTERVERESVRRYVVEVETEPAGAEASRAQPDGTFIQLGPTPLSDSIELKVAESVEVPKSTIPMVVGGVIDGLIALLAGSVFRANVNKLDDESQSLASLAFFTFLYSASAAFADLIFAAIASDRPERVLSSRPLNEDARVSYLLDKEGWSSMMVALRVPYELKVDQKLTPALILVPPLSKTSSTSTAAVDFGDEPGSPRAN